MMALASSLVKEKQLESVCPHSLTICSDFNVAFPLCLRSLDSQVGSGLEMNVGGGNNSLKLGMGWVAWSYSHRFLVSHQKFRVTISLTALLPFLSLQNV